MSEEKKMLNSEEAAEYLGVPKQTLMGYNWKRKIPFYKIGKRVFYKLSDLDNYVESCRVSAVGME